jgi:hypothetical protein
MRIVRATDKIRRSPAKVIDIGRNVSLDDIKVNPELGYKIHPFADAFPMMKGAAFDELVEDIRKNGLRDAIEYIDYVEYIESIERGDDDDERYYDTGCHSLAIMSRDDRKKIVVIDGRNRLKACRVAGADVSFTCVNHFIRTDEDLLAYIWSKNVHRRQLTASQRSMIATEHQAFIDAITKTSAQRRKATQGRPKKGAKKTGGNVALSKKTADIVAKTAKVSPRTMKDALAVKKSGNEELAKQVKAGTKSVSAAAKEVRAKKKPAKSAKPKRSGQRKRADAASPDAIADGLIAKHSPDWCMRLAQAIEKKLIASGDVLIMEVNL